MFLQLQHVALSKADAQVHFPQGQRSLGGLARSRRQVDDCSGGHSLHQVAVEGVRQVVEESGLDGVVLPFASHVLVISAANHPVSVEFSFGINCHGPTRIWNCKADVRYHIAAVCAAVGLELFLGNHVGDGHFGDNVCLHLLVDAISTNKGFASPDRLLSHHHPDILDVGIRCVFLPLWRECCEDVLVKMFTAAIRDEVTVAIVGHRALVSGVALRTSALH